MKKILFTGLSSFTGFYFVNHLSKYKNNKIFCTLSNKKRGYAFLKKKRINLISKKKNVNLIFNVRFGDKKFIDLVNKKRFDILCFHHAHTKNYNNDKKFKLKKSLNKNLNNIDELFKFIKSKSKIIITNTIFQKIPSRNYKPINNYGISKSISYEKIKNLCKIHNINYKSFFIPNPWGIYEEKKLHYYLFKNWLKNKEAIVKFPNYVRDNIHIEKLSKAYLDVVNSRSKKKEYFPSGYCSSNKVFIEALKKEFEKFFKIKTRVKYLKKTKNEQPLIRINGKKILKKVVIKEKLSNYFSYYKNYLK